MFTDPFGLKSCPPDCPVGTYTALGMMAGAALGAQGGSVGGAILGALGGLGVGLPTGPGALVFAGAGAASGGAAGGAAGAAAGAVLGGAIGAAVDGVLYLKGEAADIGRAIESVMGKGHNTQQNRRDVGDYCEECKANGIIGKKNARGDFTWGELQQRVREFFGAE